MKYIELQYAFELEAANIDAPLEGKIGSEDIKYWLNQGVDKFIKTRYNGSNPKLTSFEQDEKRARDLIGLTKTSDVTLIAGEERESFMRTKYQFPTDVMFVLNEYTEIRIVATNKAYASEIFECTLDTYMYRIMNTLTDFHLRNGRARPLRVRTNVGADLYTDKNYLVDLYKITYIRKPTPITFDKPFEEYTEFPEYAQNEIVKLAVQTYLESTANPRYQSKINENNLME